MKDGSKEGSFILPSIGILTNEEYHQSLYAYSIFLQCIGDGCHHCRHIGLPVNQSLNSLRGSYTANNPGKACPPLIMPHNCYQD